MDTAIKDSDIKQSFELAKDARKRAQVNYSNFPVGACLFFSGQEPIVITGCNLENMVMGLSHCAEQVAILKWKSGDMAEKSPLFLTVVTNQEDGAFPCGVCRQMMAQYFGADFPIYVGNLQGIQHKTTLGELFPHGFWGFTPERNS